MKNILFVTDNFLGGGLETRMIEQIKVLKKKHVKFYLLCNKFNPSYMKYFSAVSESLHLNNELEAIPSKMVMEDVNTICSFCSEHKIDFIDCQPFFCILPAALAADRTNTPISFTLHGVTSGDFILDENNLSGKAIFQLAISYGFDRHFVVAEYLTNLYSYLTDSIIIRNGSFLDSVKRVGFKNTKKVAIASRLDEVKAKIVADFLPELYACDRIKKIDIYGDGVGVEGLRALVKENQLGDKVSVVGWESNLSEKLRNSDYMAVFGMGRVVLDAIVSNIPVGVLGYGGFAGFVNHANLPVFGKTNLTSWEHSSTKLKPELESLLKNPSDYLFKRSELSDYNVERIWDQFYDLARATTHTTNFVIQSVDKMLSEKHSPNILDDRNLLLPCARLLTDGQRPISPKLFFSFFQDQHDKIYELNTTLNSRIGRRAKNLAKRLIGRR